jgi:hypothetical protein
MVLIQRVSLVMIVKLPTLWNARVVDLSNE